MDVISQYRSNPFGMQPPCQHICSDGVEAVYGYGNPMADFHLIGDHPGRHGGDETGIPFTNAPGCDSLHTVLQHVGLLEDTQEQPPEPTNLFMSYLHMCCPPAGESPSFSAYRRLEPFFDAELRGISAHVLLPVGKRPLEHVLREFTAKSSKVHGDDGELHATEIVGRGFLVMPIKELADWTARDQYALEGALSRLLESDYRQISDLTRFSPDGRLYLVR